MLQGLVGSGFRIVGTWPMRTEQPGGLRLAGRKTDLRITVWEVAQQLIRALEEQGEVGAADLLRRVGGLGEVARDLAYRLYTTCERKGWASDALAYNGLVVSWPEVRRLATGRESGAAEQGTLFGSDR